MYAREYFMEYSLKNRIRVQEVGTCQEIRGSVINFVLVYNEFVYKYGKQPQSGGSRPKENEIYQAYMYRFVVPKITEKEKNFIEDNIISLKIRDEVKDFVNQWNAFVDKYYRIPKRGSLDPKEKALYTKRVEDFAFKRVTKEEWHYLEKNLQQSKVGQIIINYVEDYNEFVLLHGHAPRHNGEKPNEKNIYERGVKLTKKQRLNEYERKYIDENAIKVIIRDVVIEFIEKFNKFVQSNERYPSHNSKNKDECSLYEMWCLFRDADILTPGEKEYYKNNLLTIDKLQAKPTIRQFVKNYKEFVQTYGAEPTRSGKNPNEIALYKQKWRYTKIKYISLIDAKFLTRNGFKVEGYGEEVTLGK